MIEFNIEDKAEYTIFGGNSLNKVALRGLLWFHQYQLIEGQ